MPAQFLASIEVVIDASQIPFVRDSSGDQHVLDIAGLAAEVRG